MNDEELAEPMERKFKEGDVVRHKSGGPKMLVLKYYETDFNERFYDDYPNELVVCRFWGEKEKGVFDKTTVQAFVDEMFREDELELNI